MLACCGCLEPQPSTGKAASADLRSDFRMRIWYLVGQHDLVASTHFPADRRPYQLQNVEAALFAAEEAGCTLDVRGEDIVNGVRSTTLNLLWTLLSSFQV